MQQFTDNFPLREFNTFAISAVAKHYLLVDSPDELARAFQRHVHLNIEKRLFLGAGSNLLFITDYDGLVIHPLIGGIKIVRQNKYHVEVEVGAGVKWDSFVALCVENGWYGIENLSLIPGNIGAVPVQNIGAYGVEASSLISEVKGIDMQSLEEISYDSEACKFGYRTSLFKEKLKENFMVTSVVFRLSLSSVFILHYEGLEPAIRQYGEINLPNIRKAIISIRESKLPDPAVFGNAGSFFKNPVVTLTIANSLKNLYPDIPIYPIRPDLVKVAAGWLIDRAGWKGRSIGDAAVHEKQALVLINKGSATGWH